MSQGMPSSSVGGFGPPGFGSSSAQHFGGQPPPTGFGPPLPPHPSVATAGPTQFDYPHGISVYSPSP